MKLLLWYAFLCLALASCGIESVSVLNAPSVDTENGTFKLTMTHSASRYSSQDAFQGYEIYYRVYPYVLGYGFQARLSADTTTLNNGPLSTLTAMGYKQFSQAEAVDSTAETNPLVVSNLSDGDVITLDFTDFGAAGNQTTTALKTVQPILTVTRGGTVVKSEYVYRTTELNTGTAYLQNFGTLRTDPLVRSDTTALPATTPAQYQVEVFIVAYGMTTSIESVHSVPTAWGEINYIPYSP